MVTRSAAGARARGWAACTGLHPWQARTLRAQPPGVVQARAAGRHDPLLRARRRCLQVPFNDAELFVVRTMVPSLAKACAMDLRTALTNAAHTTRTHLARTLLREARGPLSALQTFGSMLVPRLDDGEPDKDMAEGMMMQVGSRRLGLLCQGSEGAAHSTWGTVVLPGGWGVPSALLHAACGACGAVSSASACIRGARAQRAMAAAAAAGPCVAGVGSDNASPRLAWLRCRASGCKRWLLSWRRP